MSAPPPPPAAMIAPIRESMSLEEKLARLQAELSLAKRDPKLGQRARLHMLRAEAITDRLLEQEPPFIWLAQAYNVEARLRQIQSLADRVVAKMRRDASRETILEDIAILHGQVLKLRRALSVPGGDPPPPLDSLLAGVVDDSLRATVNEGESGE